MLVGALSLIGWLLDIDGLKSIYGNITMKANAALSLLLAGGSLWLLYVVEGKTFVHRAGQVCATTVALIGALTLSEHVFGWNLGIDQVLFTEAAGALATTSPGHRTLASSCSRFRMALLLLQAPLPFARTTLVNRCGLVGALPIWVTMGRRSFTELRVTLE
jgi:hypothetical protein